MKTKKPVIIVLGEPNSIFIEILTKVLKKKNIHSKTNYPIILIGSYKLFKLQLKILNLKLNLKIIDYRNLNFKKLRNELYLINVNYKFKKPFEKISTNSKDYISKSFKIGLDFMNNGSSNIFINGPISKKHFLKKNYPGITEFVYDKAKQKIAKNPVMLIFNKKLSVSPLTTHIALNNVKKNIVKDRIIENVNIINNFYKKILKIKPNIAVLGLNPHCENNSKDNEEKKAIIPAINQLKKKRIKVHGPFSADTLFIKNNLKKFNVVIGMYHDQVITPFKTIFEFDASNITLGLPFLRISVDHGPNEIMMGKNKSNTKSLENIFSFINSTG